MPRGRVKFGTNQGPDHPDWPRDPEKAMREIADDAHAEYIDGSLVFTHDGHVAEALFETFEIGGEKEPTDFLELGRRLRAAQLQLLIGEMTWRDWYGGPASS
jgi:hypothetical protein